LFGPGVTELAKAKPRKAMIVSSGMVTSKEERS